MKAVSVLDYRGALTGVDSIQRIHRDILVDRGVDKERE